MTQYLIDFAPSATDADISQYLTANSCTTISVFKNLDNTHLVEANVEPPVSTHVLSVIDDDASPVKLLEILNYAPAVYPSIQVTNTDDKEWWKIYSSNSTDLSSSTSTINLHKSDNIVYLLDSGIEASHPEFVGKRVELFHSLIPGVFTDTTGHGTAMASLITGSTCSINDCVVKVLKIFDDNKQTKQSDLLAAFDAIIMDAVANPSALCIVSMSWSIPRNPYIEQKLQTLLDIGVGCIAAAGNTGVAIEDVTPAAMKGVVTVGSYNHNFLPSNFSDYSTFRPVNGPAVAGETNSGILNGWAPGEQIWAAALGGQYYFINGTSAATAIHAAISMYNTAGRSANTNIGAALSSSKIIFTHVSDSFMRAGLLDLSDPKYASSPNLISTFLNTPGNSFSRSWVADLKVVVRVGDVGKEMIFNPVKTKSVDVKTPLPEWCKIVDGILFVYPTVEPTETTGVSVTNLEFDVVDNDGLTFTKNASVVVMSSTFDREALPANDPMLQVTELVICVSATAPSCSGTGCGSTACGDTGKACACDS